MAGPAESMQVDVKSDGPDAENGAAEPNQRRSGRIKHRPSILRVVLGHRGRPVTLFLGLGLIIGCEILLAIDVAASELYADGTYTFHWSDKQNRTSSPAVSRSP